MADMDIITTSHIDEAHAASEYFPEAHSADGRFAWFSGRDGYVEYGGRWVYMQHPDADIPAELLAEMRAFSAAVDELRERRQQEARRIEFEALAAPDTAMADALDRARQTGKPQFLRAVGEETAESSITAIYVRPNGSTYRVAQG